MSRYVGKRVGPARPSRTSRPLLLALALGVTVLLVVWGVLVLVAIELGGQIRSGDGSPWGWLAATCAGAVVCLFGVLLLGVRVFELVAGPRSSGLPPSVPRQGSAPEAESLPSMGTSKTAT